MNKNTKIVFGLISVTAILVGIFFLNGMNDVSEKKPEVIVNKEDVVNTPSGSYEAFSIDKISRAKTSDVVLFFNASWCPTCRALNKDIEENLSSIPENVTILKTDYDTETELKKKYEVTYQHTLVQVDESGNLIKKWSGGLKLENLLTQIK